MTEKNRWRTLPVVDRCSFGWTSATMTWLLRCGTFAAFFLRNFMLILTKPMSDRILPTPAEMIAHLDKFVLGQPRAKQDIAVAVYNHYLSQAYREAHGRDLGKHHILLIGPTGVGKTYIVRRLAEFLGVPVGFASAAGLVEAGYVGNSVESVIASLLDQAGGNPRQAEKGIVFIDEIDKIRRAAGIRDVSGEGVQNALLTLLDGRISKGTQNNEHAPVDTGRLLFICTGAFVGLKEIIERRIGLGKTKIGFAAREKEDLDQIHDRSTYEILCQVQPADLVEFGFIPEFIGRFATISVLHELSVENLQQIARGGVEHSPLAIQQELAAIHGIELVIADEALEAIAEEAASLGTGARGLHRLMGRAVDAVDHRWCELANEGVTRVVIDRECALGTGPPELIKGGPEELSAMQRHDLELRKEALAGLPSSPKPAIEAAREASIPKGISDSRGWSEERIWDRIEKLKSEKLEWDETKGTARRWWKTFEEENKHRPRLILRLVEELANRDASISEFFLAYVYSNTDNILANLHYLDYVRLKKEEEEKRKKRKKK